MTIKNLESPKPYTEVLVKYGKAFNHKIGEFYFDVEYEMVKKGYRDANVFHLSPQNYDNEIDKIMEDGLVFKPIFRSEVYNGFSHTHFPTKSLGQNTMVYGVVAKNLKTAQLFKQYHLGNYTEHKEIGKLLGYPDCCCESFTKYFNKSFDPVYEPAENTKGIKKVNNKITLPKKSFNEQLRVDLRYIGIRIIPFFPCSYDCVNAGKVAKTWLKVMYSLDEKITDEIIEYLEKPSVWSNLNGQVLVKHPDFLIMAGGYHDKEYKEVKFE